MRRSWLNILLALLVSVMAMMSHRILNHYSSADEFATSKFQAAIINHQSCMNSHIDDIIDSLKSDNVVDVFECLGRAGTNNNYCFYVFRKKVLVGWHNALLPVQDLRESMLRRNIVRFDNGWYYVLSRLEDNISVYALLRIKSRYSIDNEYLKSEFDPSFDINSNASILFDPKAEGSQIFDAEGRYLFNLGGTYTENGVVGESVLMQFVDLLFLVVWLFFAIVAVLLFVREFVRIGVRNRSIFILALLLACVYWWALNIEVSEPMVRWFVFSSQVFAYGWWAPSLAYLLLFSLMVFIICYYTYRLFDFRALDKWQLVERHSGIVYLALLCFLYFIFVAVNVAVNIMVYNSTDFAIYVDQLDVSGTSMVKMVVISMLFLSFIFVIERVYSEIVSNLTWTKFWLVLSLFCLVVIVPTYFILIWFEQVFFIGFVLINIIYFYVKKHHTDNNLRYSSYVWLMFVVALFVMQRLTELNTAKERQNRDLLLDNLSFNLVREDDPVAESRLLSIEHSIVTDTVVMKFFNQDSWLSADEEFNLYGYLRERYFDGYFSRYDLQVIPCRGSDSYIQMTSSGEQYNCYEYFSDMVNLFGRKIGPKSNFYGLEDNDGRASYFGQFRFYCSRTSSWQRLYIEINYRPYSTESGYPELLTNSRDRIDTKQLKGYSYARYFDNSISTTFGSYSYPKTSEWLGDLQIGSKRTVVCNEYSHVAYEVAEGQIVVLSYPVMTASQYLADYSYLFLGMFIVCSALLYIVGRKHGMVFDMTIHERIQSTFILFVMSLLVVICVLSAIEAFRNYEYESSSRMSQNMESVKRLLQNEIDMLSSDDENAQIYTDNLLQRSSKMFSADVHLYSADGSLMGTSRRELFDNGIVSPLINSAALIGLRANNSDVFIKESIGNLVHYSVYSPLINTDDELVGYINLPYFTDVSAMRRQLMSTIVPITNSYMFVMLLAVLFSFFLAKGITKPLAIISNRLRDVDLQKKNEKICYPNNDEIGVLVGEYNRMIDELSHSAERLAVTEREMTWREMARQIAHEIKNPLTPMKLSVQYMIKAWEDNRPDFDVFIHKVSTTLVSQIDQLSFIASEFSNVARMPQGETGRVDVVQRLANAVELYGRTENAEVTIDMKVKSAFVMANADQLTSVFNNLIKNALQSVSSGKWVKVETSVCIVDGGKVLITVKDNGRGIAEELRDKIFKPNFTTKSTGMGLGLAIVKTIVMNANGEIWFDTELGKGTTFYVSLPVV